MSRRFILPKACPHFFCSNGDTILYTSKVIKSRSNIQRENGRAIRFGGCRVVVDDVANFLPSLRAADDPIVTVKRWFITIYIFQNLKLNVHTG